MTSPAKNPKHSNIKKIETTRLPTSLEGLNSSLAQSASELWWCKVTQSGLKYEYIVPWCCRC